MEDAGVRLVLVSITEAGSEESNTERSLFLNPSMDISGSNFNNGSLLVFFPSSLEISKEPSFLFPSWNELLVPEKESWDKESSANPKVSKKFDDFDLLNDKPFFLFFKFDLGPGFEVDVSEISTWPVNRLSANDDDNLGLLEKESEIVAGCRALIFILAFVL